MAKEAGEDGPQPAKLGLLAESLAKLKEGWEDLRVGDGHLEAMGRLGLAELRNAFNPSRESVATTDMGLYGSAIQTEIAEAREGPAQKPYSMDDLREAGKAATQQAQKDNDDRDQDRGRER